MPIYRTEGYQITQGVCKSGHFFQVQTLMPIAYILWIFFTKFCLCVHSIALFHVESIRNAYMIGFLHSQPCFLGGPNYTDLPYINCALRFCFVDVWYCMGSFIMSLGLCFNDPLTIGWIENNVCTRVTNCSSAHKRVILVFISRVAKQRGK